MEVNFHVTVSLHCSVRPPPAECFGLLAQVTEKSIHSTPPRTDTHAARLDRRPPSSPQHMLTTNVALLAKVAFASPSWLWLLCHNGEAKATFARLSP